MTSKQKRAFIVIPTYNEKDNIGRLVTHLIEIVFQKIDPKWDMNILVVDDSSPDGTAEVVQELQKKYPNLHLKINEKKNGLGAAYMSGMGHAVDNLDADILFEMDADFSHDPAVIPHFLEKIDQGYDLVLGSRYIKGGSIPKNWGIHRKILSIVGNLVVQLIMTYFAVKDWTGGYRAIKKELFQALRKEMKRDEFTGYTFQIGFLHKAIRKGFKITEVPFHFSDREYGKSKIGADYLFTALKYIITIRIIELKRLVKFGMVGTIGFIVNFTAMEVFHNGLHISPDNAAALGAELAIISNFTLNNVWTFKDRKISGKDESYLFGKKISGRLKIILKFIQFNLASFGAVLIQKVVVWIGIQLAGPQLYRIYFLIAVGFGMILNFTVYNKIIWRDKSK